MPELRYKIQLDLCGKFSDLFTQYIGFTGKSRISTIFNMIKQLKIVAAAKKVWLTLQEALRMDSDHSNLLRWGAPPNKHKCVQKVAKVRSFTHFFP